MPPLVVYKTQYLNDTWTINRPRDATYAVTISRWMFNVIFEQWFQNSLIPRFIYNKKPAMVFFDGHGSHLTYGTVKRVTEKEIIIIIIFFHHALNVCMMRFGSGT